MNSSDRQGDGIIKRNLFPRGINPREDLQICQLRDARLVGSEETVAPARHSFVVAAHTCETFQAIGITKQQQRQRQ